MDTIMTETRSASVSLAGLLLENNSKRLYTEPIQWTDTHLRLLECSFVTRENIEPMTDQHERPNGSKSKLEAFRALSDGSSHSRLVKHALGELISSFFSLVPKHLVVGAGLSVTFYYQRTTRRNIRVNNVFLTPFISLAHLDLDDLQVWRNALVDRRYGRALRRNKSRENGPVLSLIRGKQRLLEPENPDHDPYILAVLLALAQKKQMGDSSDRSAWSKVSTSPSPPSPVNGVGPDTKSSTEKSFKVGVIATRCNDPNGFLQLYTCRVPATFLSRFDMPKRKFDAVPLEIETSIIQLSSSSAAVEQLGAVLHSP